MMSALAATPVWYPTFMIVPLFRVLFKVYKPKPVSIIARKIL